MRMQGHGHEIGNIGELLGVLAQMASEGKKPLTHEEFIKEAIAEQELNIKMAQTVLGILTAPPPVPGAKLVALDGMKPSNPEKHGLATIATYELDTGVFQIVGTDHQTNEQIAHTAPNLKGVPGLIDSIKHELTERSIAAEKAADAAEKAKSPEAPAAADAQAAT